MQNLLVFLFGGGLVFDLCRARSFHDQVLLRLELLAACLLECRSEGGGLL